MTTSWYVPNICLEGGIYVFAIYKFALRLSASRDDPLFYLQTEVFTKRPTSFYSPHQMTPYIFLLSSLKEPLFSLFSLSPKDPYFGSRVRTYPSLPYVSAPPGSHPDYLNRVHQPVAICKCSIFVGHEWSRVDDSNIKAHGESFKSFIVGFHFVLDLIFNKQLKYGFWQ